MNMNNNKRTPKKRRGAKLGLALCMAAALVLTGLYTFNQYKSNVKKQMAKIEEESRAELEQYADAGDSMNEEAQGGIFNTDGTGGIYDGYSTKEGIDGQRAEGGSADGNTDAEAGGGETRGNATEGADNADGISGTEGRQASAPESRETAGAGSQINFSEGDTLIWPVSGAVLMNYSMDETVYFSTLDQYKYNPALIIGGAVNDQVISAGKGIVKSIDRSAQVGTTVNVDMGNGYEAIYGQLQDVQVKTGDQVEAKTVIGYLAEPTRYYSVEGCNLYFEFRKDGQPVDPLSYLGE